MIIIIYFYYYYYYYSIGLVLTRMASEESSLVSPLNSHLQGCVRQ